MLFVPYSRRARELSGVGVQPVQRVDVLHFDVDLLELVSRLERLPPHQPGVVDLRIPDGRKLPLRVGRLPAQCRIAADALRRQTAGDTWVGRQPGDPERIGVTERRRVLATLGVRPAEADLEQRPIGRHVGGADDELLVARVDVAVSAAARWQRNRRLIVGAETAPAVAAEQRHRRAGLEVKFSARLVRIVGELLRDRIVVGGASRRWAPAGRRAPGARTRSSESACPPDR